MIGEQEGQKRAADGRERQKGKMSEKPVQRLAWREGYSKFIKIAYVLFYCYA